MKNKISDLTKAVLTKSLSRNPHENSISGKGIRHKAKLAALGLAFTVMPTISQGVDRYLNKEISEQKNKYAIEESAPTKMKANKVKSAEAYDYEKLAIFDPYSAPIYPEGPEQKDKEYNWDDLNNVEDVRNAKKLI